MDTMANSSRAMKLCICCLFLVFLFYSPSHCTTELEEDITGDVEDTEGETSEDLRGTRPRRVSAEVVNATTINLTWKPPAVSGPHCPVRRYVLRLKQEGARNSRAWRVDGRRNALGLHNLRQDTTYYLRLVSVTSCRGKGKPSKWLDIRTTQPRSNDNQRNKRGGIETRPPGKPTYVRTRTFSDSVILTWRPPEDEGILVRGYMVGYGEGVPDVNWQYVDASHRNVTIKNLKSATQYIVSLRAFNHFGKGPTVYDLIYTREHTETEVDEDSIIPPSNLRAKVLSPTTVWLQWADPSLDRHQHIPDSRYYNVHYRIDPEGDTLSVVVKAMHVVLYDLSPGTRYEFRVRTVRESSYSEFSAPVTNVTFETAPGSPPRSLAIVPSNKTGRVDVSWRPPRQPNGKITGYLVLYTSNRNMPVADWIALGTPDTKAVVNDLIPNTTYYFKVQARNSIGYGPLSKTAVLTTPAEIIDLHMNQIITSAQLGPSPEDVEDYNVEEAEDYNEIESDYEEENYDEDPDDGNKGEPVADETEPSGDVADIKDGNRLIPESAVDSTETAASQDNATAPASKSKRHDGTDVETPEEDKSSQKTKGGMSEITFTAEVLHKIQAFITWPVTPPGCECVDIAPDMNYAFHYYMRGKEEQPNMRVLSNNVVHMDDLRVAETYLYQVKYIFPNGTESSWSEEQILSTGCG